MDSVLATNGNTMEFSEQGDSQGFSQPRAREEAGRLQRSLRNLKGLLTREVNQCNDKIAHFKLKFAEDYTTVTVVKIGYAQSIIDNHNRCSTRFLNLERALEKLRELECNTWVGSDEELDNVLEKLNQDSISCEKQYLKVNRDNDDIFEICNTIIAASKPTVTRPHNPGAGITPATMPNISFKPQKKI